MQIKSLVESYFRMLEESYLPGILKLFHANAFVNSPIYGRKDAKSFFEILLRDTKNSKISIKQIYTNVTGCAVHFTYNWELENENSVIFDGVDIFKTDSGLISELTIIYDTFDSRSKLLI